MQIDETQACLDTFYILKGPCCAGCDWWRHLNSVVGECKKSAPVSGDDRLAMIGIQSSSQSIGAGHVVTKRDHLCGAFKDDFDWNSLPLAYLKRIGFQNKSPSPSKATGRVYQIGV